jgi:transposase
LVKAIETVPKPRIIVFEEGPLADWLYRNLVPHANRVIVCDPRRNALITKEEDKDDSIDAGKLADLARGDFVRAVHHPESMWRSIFKQVVSEYHQGVSHRVAEANRVIGLFRRWGLIVVEKHIKTEEARNRLLQELPYSAVVHSLFEASFATYQTAVEQEDVRRKLLTRLARKEDVIRRWDGLPGIGWVRGSTLFAYLDTPWRFERKSRLWKYMGIGLKNRTSGSGPKIVQLSRRANGRLKDTILGAAKSAIASKDNPFAAQYRRWREAGLDPSTARRNVARSMAVTVWSMWKTGDVYRPERVAANGRGSLE